MDTCAGGGGGAEWEQPNVGEGAADDPHHTKLCWPHSQAQHRPSPSPAITPWPVTLPGLGVPPFSAGLVSSFLPSVKWLSSPQSVSSKKGTESLEAVSSWEGCLEEEVQGGTSGTLVCCYVWQQGKLRCGVSLHLTRPCCGQGRAPRHLQGFGCSTSDQLSPCLQSGMHLPPQAERQGGSIIPSSINDSQQPQFSFSTSMQHTIM